MKGDNQDLIDKAIESTKKARAIAKTREDWKWMGYIGAALITEEERIFTGINLSLFCGIGFCSEHSAIAEMVKHGETKIKKIVATTAKGTVLPPCGRCRELMYQIDKSNVDTEVILAKDRLVLLRELLPENWQESMDEPLF